MVKHGIIAYIAGQTVGDPFLVDGINNPGFSGGPVVRVDNPQKPAVIGVVSAYGVTQERVYRGQTKTDLTVPVNNGLLAAFGLEYALEAIKKDQTSK